MLFDPHVNVTHMVCDAIDVLDDVVQDVIDIFLPVSGHADLSCLVYGAYTFINLSVEIRRPLPVGKFLPNHQQFARYM